MRAFEIRLNGRKLCVADLEEGTVLFSIGCTENKNGRGAVGLSMTGMSFLKEEMVRWQHRTLRTNDDIRIKIIEAEAVDTPRTIQKGFHPGGGQTKSRRTGSNRKPSEDRRVMGQLNHIRAGRKFSREELNER